jgi:hypothetical protein
VADIDREAEAAIEHRTADHSYQAQQRANGDE